MVIDKKLMNMKGNDFYNWFLEKNGIDIYIKPVYDKMRETGETILGFYDFLVIFPDVTPRSIEGKELQCFLGMEWEEYYNEQTIYNGGTV